jgi:oxygen-independent coproporphyrinogen-3 oxidase
VKKCPYCDFNSHEGGDRAGYINALLEDLRADLPYVQDREIGSIFIGGGTPSLMQADELRILLEGLTQYLTFKKEIEITLEANPNSFEVGKFQAFKEAGVNRLSIGVQSFEGTNLHNLGRVHTALEAFDACKQASRIFDNFNIDLMYGLTQQSLAGSQQDIKTALSFSPKHLSFYQLTIEPNTYFHKHTPSLPTQEMLWQMGEAGETLLMRAGLARYEVSAFGSPAKHNLNYWEFGDYIGIGAGAHGKITLPNQTPFRTLKAKNPKDYLQDFGKKITVIENLSFDFMLNALRLKEGFEVDLFSQRTGLSLQTIVEELEKAQDLNLLNITKNRIKPTSKGFYFLNDLQEIFLC